MMPFASKSLTSLSVSAAGWLIVRWLMRRENLSVLPALSVKARHSLVTEGQPAPGSQPTEGLLVELVVSSPQPIAVDATSPRRMENVRFDMAAPDRRKD